MTESLSNPTLHDAIRTAEEESGVSQATAAAVKTRLRKAGIRLTRQRLHLGKTIFSKGDRHFTAELIHGEASAVQPSPSLATVYNTLREFTERGLIREVAVYGSTVWYDTKTGPHFHFYNCNSAELLDVPSEWVPDISIPVPEGMKAVGIDVVVRLEPVAKARKR